MADVLNLGSGTHETKTLPVKVVAGGRTRTYKVPLRGSLKLADVMLFREPDDLPEEKQGMHAVDTFYQFLCRYIPKEAVDELDMDDLNAFYDAWDAASEQEDGITEGE